MVKWIELTSLASKEMRWLVSIDAIAFVRRKSVHDDASVLLKSGGNIEPEETYTDIIAMLASFDGVA